ncbi:MAG: hypothetical protein M1827_006384 [Pycnora praestabilis]|nr:MAG: hypothetical protein M1827_006384 [Pycnora praestabilis]
MVDKTTLEIVIAHYNEDVDWLEPVKDFCTIYSKGGPKNLPPYPSIPLPNIGREGHTYLQHIAEQYDALPDVTIFLQGHVDDHVSISVEEIVERSIKTRPGQVTTFPFRELELFDCWDGIPWEDYPSWKKWSSMECKRSPKSPGQYWQQTIGFENVPASVGFAPGALFAVRRETIQHYPRSYYQLLLEDFFLGEMAHVNPETGHYMERFWLAIWNPSEYICWNAETDVALEERNAQGQLTKGHWHRTPKYVDLDVYTLHPTAAQLRESSPTDAGRFMAKAE